MRRIALFPAALVVLLWLAAGNSLAATVEVEMQDFRFVPETVTVQAGDTIVWTNVGQAQHTTTSGTNCTPNGMWDSGLLSSGESFSRVFQEAGTFPYYCIPHCDIGMTGTVVVNPSDEGPDNAVVVDSDDPEVSASFAPGQLVDLKVKTETGVRAWIFLEAPEAFQGLRFARVSDAVAEQEGRFVLLYSVEGQPVQGAENYFFAASSQTDKIDFGANNFEGLGTLVIISMKGESPGNLERIQRITLQSEE